MGKSERGAILDRKVAVRDLEVQAASSENTNLSRAPRASIRNTSGARLNPMYGVVQPRNGLPRIAMPNRRKRMPLKYPTTSAPRCNCATTTSPLGERGDELEPVTSLREHAIAESVQRVPVDVMEWRSVHFEQRTGPRAGERHGEVDTAPLRAETPPHLNRKRPRELEAADAGFSTRAAPPTAAFAENR
jgi:hypothetical protein